MTKQQNNQTTQQTEEQRLIADAESFSQLLVQLAKVFELYRSTGNTTVLMRQHGIVLQPTNQAARHANKIDGATCMAISFKDMLSAITKEGIDPEQIKTDLPGPLFVDNFSVMVLADKAKTYINSLLQTNSKKSTAIQELETKQKKLAADFDSHFDKGGADAKHVNSLQRQLANAKNDNKELEKQAEEYLHLSEALTTKVKAVQNMTFWQRLKALFGGKDWMNKNILHETGSKPAE